VWELGRLVGRGREVAEPRQATHEGVPHQVTRGEELGIGEAIPNDAPISHRLDNAGGAHRTEVLGSGGLVQAEGAGDLVHLVAPPPIRCRIRRRFGLARVLIRVACSSSISSPIGSMPMPHMRSEYLYVLSI
jgi:hypothetical protein